jgi:urease subunit gamma/beta
MLLTPTERDRVLLFSVAQLARARRARGLKLNVPEAIAIIADTVCEAARDGARHSQALDAGRSVLGVDDVLPGVSGVVLDVRVEAVFDDGSRLVVVPDPFRILPDGTAAGTAAGAVAGAVAGAGEPAAGEGIGDLPAGAVITSVVNTAEVPISVSSHFHFFEANPRLRYRRVDGYGRHLWIPAGSTVRFEPGADRSVVLVPFGGERIVIGFSGLVDGALDAPGALEAALAKARACGYLDTDEESLR